MITITLSSTVVKWIIEFLWLILGFIMAIKQEEALDTESSTLRDILIIILAPLVLIGATVRQVFIEKWK